MPWTVSNPPPPAKNWPEKKKRACVSAANAALERGDSEEDAIFACIGAAENVKQFEEEADNQYWELVDAARSDMMEYGEQLADGEIGEDDFEDKMRQRILALMVALAFLGGEFDRTNENHVGELEYYVNATYGLLDDFMSRIRAEDLSRAYIVWRAGLYSNHRHVFIRYTLPEDVFLRLPEFPGISCLGDGYCGCWLEIEETGGGWNVYWNLNPLKEHCSVCLDLESSWNPLFISTE